MSYRDLEEIPAERGVVVDHAGLNRWGGQIRLGFDHGGATQEGHDGAVVAPRRDLCEGPRRVVFPLLRGRSKRPNS